MNEPDSCKVQDAAGVSVAIAPACTREGNLTNAGKGRKPGVPNRVTRRVRDSIAQALAMTAPQIAEWLRQVGESDPRVGLQFATALARVALPKSSKVEEPPGVSALIAPAREDDAGAFRDQYARPRPREVRSDQQSADSGPPVGEVSRPSARADAREAETAGGSEADLQPQEFRQDYVRARAETAAASGPSDPEAYAAECERFHKSQAREEAYPPGHPEPLPRAPAAAEAPGAAWKPRRIEIPDEYVGDAQYNPLESK